MGKRSPRKPHESSGVRTDVSARGTPALTGDPATDQALLDLAEVLAEIARDVARRSAEEHETQSLEGKEDDRRS